MADRCINIDWLEVYALEDASVFPVDADYFRRCGYFVRERDYGTRVWGQMFTILDDHDEPFIEVRRAPMSTKDVNGGLLPPEACHLRLTNRACYLPSPISALRDFMARHNYQLVRIFRLDIALDFERFDKGDDPAAFIARYMNGRYSKINQANISAHGIDRWDGRLWNSLSWGSPQSMVGTKFYCKTLELQQASDKPYIRYAWFQAGLIDDLISMTKVNAAGETYKPAIWRVEFSIKAAARYWYEIRKSDGKKGGIRMPHVLSVYDTPMKLEAAFASLARHYFHFKHYEDGKRKDRCKDKVLFDFSPRDTFYKIDRLATHAANTSPQQRLIALLRNYDLIVTDPDVHKAIRVIIEYLQFHILKTMSEAGTPHADIIALQQLIAQRSKGIREKSPLQQLEELRSIIEQEGELF